MNLFDRLALHAGRCPDAPAIVSAGGVIDYAGLQAQLEGLIPRVRELGVQTLALDLDNGPAWALIDLAALACGLTLIPLPPFFSPAQLRHTLTEAGVEMVVSDQPQRLRQRLAGLTLQACGQLSANGLNASCLATDLPRRKLPGNVAKITFTSGTTAEPKGVMLTWSQMQRVVSALAGAVGVVPGDRHVALTPLAVLLENIAGLYVPLWAGASLALPALSETGLLGAAGLDAQRMMHALAEYDASSAIFSPQMLQGAIAHLQSGHAAPAGLRFIAVGGAAVSPRLLEQAAELRLPVYEGYGLSEFASVVCLNTPDTQRTGSVGKPLDHVAIRIAEDGEVLILGNRFAGYLGEPAPDEDSVWWHSGDIGHFDSDGFLYLKGRRRHIFITAFGRNVSPAWVERELVLEPAIVQAAVFGEARPWNAAVIVPAAGADATAVAEALQRVNCQLPDYARVSQWIHALTPFDVQNGQLSGTGRLRRHAIFQHYQERIDALYREELVS